MHLASRVLACGADFRLIGPERSFSYSDAPGNLRLRRAHRLRQGFGGPAHFQTASRTKPAAGGCAPPDALRRSGCTSGATLRDRRRLRPAQLHHRRARRIRTAYQRGRDRLRRRRLRAHSATRQKKKPMSFSGTAATTTGRFSAPTWKSSCSIRTAPAMSCSIIPVKPIFAAPRC